MLGCLGYGVVLELEGVVVGFGTDPHSILEIRQEDANAALSAAIHVAFRTDSEDAVRAFHEMALAMGGRDDGSPGLRPDYEPGYFAAFVIDRTVITLKPFSADQHDTTAAGFLCGYHLRHQQSHDRLAQKSGLEPRNLHGIADPR